MNFNQYKDSSSYFGGVFREEAIVRLVEKKDISAEFRHRSSSGDHFLFRNTMPSTYQLVRDRKLIAMHGYTADVSDRPIQQVLEILLSQYESNGKLDATSLDGSFTLFLFDAEAEQVFLYRNLVGVAASYYTQAKDGFIFGSNLAEVACRSGMALAINQKMLPIYFACRCVPGTNTLFDRIHRLQPGELLTYRNKRLTTQLAQTFADFEENHKADEAEAIDRIESTMEAVTRDQMAAHPNSAGFLSGGVDSTYIQVHWNKQWRVAYPDSKPKSTAIWLDHPQTKFDQDYCMTAVEETGTTHLPVRINGLTAMEMQEILAATGEMPNHVQSFYFATLGKAMASNGIEAGLCGDGADGLFGAETSSVLQRVNQLRRKYPSVPLRSFIASLAERTGHPYGAQMLRIANIINDLLDMRHPINTNGAFTNWQFLEDCFGISGVNDVLNYRLEIIRQTGIPQDALNLTWGTMGAYINSAVGTASVWNQMLSLSGAELLCPFLDSRIIRTAINIDDSVRYVQGNPKQILKKTLGRHVSNEFINRPKRGFGQPIMEWMSENGPLGDAINSIATSEYDFLTAKALAEMKAKPDWFLYNLLVLDLWRKAFQL